MDLFLKEKYILLIDILNVFRINRFMKFICIMIEFKICGKYLNLEFWFFFFKKYVLFYFVFGFFGCNMFFCFLN